MKAVTGLHYHGCHPQSPTPATKISIPVSPGGGTEAALLGKGRYKAWALAAIALLALWSMFAASVTLRWSSGDLATAFQDVSDPLFDDLDPLDGTGHSRTVQGAVDMVPAGNTRRVKILVKPGVYREKVTVPITKPFVSLIGMGTGRTVITWNARASDIDPSGHQVGTFLSASVAVEADYFCASHITFENSAPAAPPGAVGQQAVALRLSGDKTMLYRCRILGTQDTLFDNIGRHYLFNCDIQGSIDFIFGNARSLYQGCRLHAVATSYGAIAASQRSSPSEESGFSFVGCRLTGSGMLYLGRAWGKYARVVYSYCDLSGIVVPQGWSDWGDHTRTKTVLFGEYNCKGPGASSRQRVPWSRALTYDEARPFLGRDFINGEQWLRL
ncbi:pectinesterase QRT1-like [Lolium rigidum]|uniref:pectinesterase QRT1-like n=1 Tax=Lolium rigidum TaxID=89674 RepID=UPI001F5CBF61|nr:pectinesterase QRT1-like [Lolium rigidum]